MPSFRLCYAGSHRRLPIEISGELLARTAGRILQLALLFQPWFIATKHALSTVEGALRHKARPVRLCSGQALSASRRGTESHFYIGHSLFTIRYSNPSYFLIPRYPEHLPPVILLSWFPDCLPAPFFLFYFPLFTFWLLPPAFPCNQKRTSYIPFNLI